MFLVFIGNLNINSVVNKIDAVKELLNRNMFDILFLAETKIDSTVSSHLVSHSGFRTIRKDRKKGLEVCLPLSRMTSRCIDA